MATVGAALGLLAMANLSSFTPLRATAYTAIVRVEEVIPDNICYPQDGDFTGPKPVWDGCITISDIVPSSF
jgi:hypothetical protein